MKKLLTLIPLMLITTSVWAQQYVTEDLPASSGTSGMACMAVRCDTQAAAGCIAGTEGDWIALQTDALGNLRVSAQVPTGGSNPGKAEDSGRADADVLFAIAAVRDDALSANQETTTDLDYGVVRSDNYGALWSHPVTFSAVLTDTTTIEAAAYASGDCLEAAAVALTGTAVQAPFLGGTVKDVVITDLSGQASNLDVVFFTADPGAVCAAINAAFDLADDDIDKVAGVVHVTDHIALADSSVSQATNVNLRYVLASGTALYYAVRVAGAPTYTSTADLSVRVKVEWD